MYVLLSRSPLSNAREDSRSMERLNHVVVGRGRSPVNGLTFISFC